MGSQFKCFLASHCLSSLHLLSSFLSSFLFPFPFLSLLTSLCLSLSLAPLSLSLSPETQTQISSVTQGHSFGRCFFLLKEKMLNI